MMPLVALFGAPALSSMQLGVPESRSWHEVKLSSASAGSTIGKALANGDSVIVCPRIASDSECTALLEIGLAAADIVSAENSCRERGAHEQQPR